MSVHVLLRYYVLYLFCNEFNKCKKDSKDQDSIQYNQVPHLTQYTKWESNKITINFTNKSQGVIPFPAGDHKAEMNRRNRMINIMHK